MSPDVSTAANTTHHSEHLADRAAMLAMRTMIALQPKADLGPAGRAAFDELMEKTPSAEGVAYEAATVGGVPGWWCRPAGCCRLARDQSKATSRKRRRGEAPRFRPPYAREAGAR
jgi:hypothetical protein